MPQDGSTINHNLYMINSYALNLRVTIHNSLYLVVALLDVVYGKNEQSGLFNPEPNNEKLMSVFDTLNDKYGRDTVFLGSQGTQKKWEMRRDLLSPQYTTNWKHIPVISCK